MKKEICKEQALVIHKQKKEQYYKSAKLAPGALPGRTFAQNLSHLDNYIQHMKDYPKDRFSILGGIRSNYNILIGKEGRDSRFKHTNQGCCQQVSTPRVQLR